MKVKDVLAILNKCDPELDVAVEQVFRKHRSITLRSIEIVNGCVTFKDHNVRLSPRSEFIAFDGATFEVPNSWENLESMPR
jgi:hypothetical protein